MVTSTIIDALYAEYTRTVAIVSSLGIPDFINWTSQSLATP
jgi:hypothetical protein